MILDFIVYSVAIVLFVAMSYAAVTLRNRNKSLSARLLQMTIDKQLLLKHVENTAKVSNDDSIEKTEGFLRFISESRDWAFEYIEDVQKNLKEYADVVGPQLKYYKTYGQAIESPHMIILDRIAEVYPLIESLLPEHNPDK